MSVATMAQAGEIAEKLKKRSRNEVQKLIDGWDLIEALMGMNRDPSTVNRTAFQNILRDPADRSEFTVGMLGIEQGTWSLLLSKDVYRLDELLERDEFTICSMLVEDNDGFPMSDDKIKRALERFMDLRRCLDEQELKLAGPRHTAHELYRKF